MDKNKKEKELLLQLSREHGATNNCFTEPDKNADTYFIKRENSNSLTEYDFQTIPELTALLQQELQSVDNEEIIKLLSIATFKNRPVADAHMSSPKTSGFAKDGEVLPSHIYNM